PGARPLAAWRRSAPAYGPAPASITSIGPDILPAYDICNGPIYGGPHRDISDHEMCRVLITNSDQVEHDQRPSGCRHYASLVLQRSAATCDLPPAPETT